MRKLTFAAIIFGALSMASCSLAQKPKLATSLDSLSYAIGYARTDGFFDYLQQYGIDSTLMVDFMRGFNEGVDATSPKEMAKIMGVQIGQSVAKWKDDFDNQLLSSDATEKFSKDLIIDGFRAGVNKAESSWALADIQAFVNMRTEQMYKDKQSGDEKAKTEAQDKFLQENLKKEGVKATESGLQYKVIKEGTGKVPTADSKVRVHYKGTLIDGTQFDSSYDRGEPAEFGVNQVIAGWTEALQMMPVGSQWELYIPYELGYGSQDNGTIPPYSTLIFQVELLDIVE